MFLHREQYKRQPATLGIYLLQTTLPVIAALNQSQKRLQVWIEQGASASPGFPNCGAVLELCPIPRRDEWHRAGHLWGTSWWAQLQKPGTQGLKVASSDQLFILNMRKWVLSVFQYYWWKGKKKCYLLCRWWDVLGDANHWYFLSCTVWT